MALRALSPLHPASCTLLPLLPAPLLPCSLLPASRFPPCARLAPLSPEGLSGLRSREREREHARGVGVVGYGGGVPPGHAQGACPGVHHPTLPPHHRSCYRSRSRLRGPGRPSGLNGLAGSGWKGSQAAGRPDVTVSSAVLARSTKAGKAGFLERLDRIQVPGGLGRPGCTGLGGVVLEPLKPPDVTDGTDGTERDGRTGRNGTERDGKAP